jgi:hypothetical protein
MSRRTLFLAFVVVALIGAMSIASLAGARFERAPTVVKIRGNNGDYHGRITSNRRGCLGDRIVKVFKQKGDRQRPKRDKVIGKDTSERSEINGAQVGIWSVGNTGFKTGKFYAKVRRTDACKQAYSDTISR